jgi:signal transduction histidine kinase
LHSKPTLRKQMLIRLALLTLFAVMTTTLWSIAASYINGRHEALARMELVAASKEAQLTASLQSLLQQLFIASQTDASAENIEVILDWANENKRYTFYNTVVRRRLQGLVLQSNLVQEIFLIDDRNQVVLSTDPSQEGKNFLEIAPSWQPQASAPVPLVVLASDASESSAEASGYLIGTVPVLGSDGRMLGSIAGRAALGLVKDILKEPTGLGVSGNAYLVGHDLRLLGTHEPPLFPDGDPTQSVVAGVTTALESRSTTSGVFRDHLGRQVMGAYRYLPEMGAVLSVEQPVAEALALLMTTIKVNLVIGLMALLGAASASLAITQSVTAPLVRLADSVRRISTGNLDEVIRFERDDEVGAVAEAFNAMTRQLRELIGGLEQRVKDRTLALREANASLARRAVQQETSMRVAREITSILDVNALLAQVVKVIETAFSYYCVHIYLLDHETGQLVLRATSADPGPQERELDITERSINARTVRTGKTQVVCDVAVDQDYLVDPAFPETHSEAVALLRIGDRVIGTLDVHCTAVNAISDEDAQVLQSLADQIAVAIENARLYRRSRALAVLEERTRLARELHDSVAQSLYSLVLLSEGWRRLSQAGQAPDINAQLRRLGEIAQQSLKEMRLLIYQLRVPKLEELGLLQALHQRLDAVERRAGIDARLIVDDLFEIPEDTENALYWIAQEALNNSLKHARAASVHVHLCCEEPHHIALVVSDDGQGFDLTEAPTSGGMGLIGMRERAEAHGGELSVFSAAGEGTEVRAKLRIAADHRCDTNGVDLDEELSL